MIGSLLNDAALTYTKHGGFKHYRRVLNLADCNMPSPRTICGQRAVPLEHRSRFWQWALPHAPECSHCLIKMTLQDFIIIARREDANRGH